MTGSAASASLRADDRAILDVLADGPLSANEIADRIRRRVREEWSDRHGYDFEWETDEEPVGARLLAMCEAKDAGLKIHGWEIHSRCRSLERRGAVERIQIEGQRPMLWRSRV